MGVLEPILLLLCIAVIGALLGTALTRKNSPTSQIIASEAERIAREDITMKLKQLFVAVPATLLVLGSGAANAGQTINQTGALAC